MNRDWLTKEYIEKYNPSEKRTPGIPGHICYTVGDTDVLVGSRPDTFGTDVQFFYKVGAFLSVSDRPVNYPLGKEVKWFPWNEELDAPYNVIFPSLITLHNWICEEKLETVYIHCCAGTHRAPTIFGAFLWTYFNDQMEAIVNSAVAVNREHPSYSSPLYYFENHLRKNPQDKKFFLAMRDYNYSKDYNYESLDAVLNEIGLEDETRRSVFPSKVESYKEAIKDIADHCFSQIHWTNTKVGKKHKEVLQEVLGEKKNIKPDDSKGILKSNPVKYECFFTEHFPSLERISSQAYKMALSIHGIDESGNGPDERFPRSSSCMKVKFLGFTLTGDMGGGENVYEFETWLEREPEEE